ncbi:hypothetical protein [Photorhabdus sp. RM323S]|uniref:hypothetical protein n=1 Tax=Photorhabdus sp. RM323S TaxID=3342828 RepID=UPI0036D77E46
MEIWSILEDELTRYRDLSSSIRQLLMKYEVECSELILEIKGRSFEDSQDIFNHLYDIQKKLATTLYKYEFNLSDRLKEFVYHFDRDDIYSRKYWYQKFKNGLTWPED